MNIKTILLAAASLTASGAAIAGIAVPLGAPLGVALGSVLGIPLGVVSLGSVLGIPLGSLVPLGAGLSDANVTMLVVTAISLAVGITIVQRKQKR